MMAVRVCEGKAGFVMAVRVCDGLRVCEGL